MNAEQILDRYIADVQSKLPRRARSDVPEELRSLLLESAQERAAESARPLDAGLMLAVVRRFGHPEEVALRYAGRHQYLIGPQFFPLYSVVVGIVMAVAALGYIAVSIARETPVGQAISGGLQLALVNFAVLTIVFATLERIDAYQAGKRTAPKLWEPAEEDEEPARDPDAIAPSSIAFNLYAIIILAYLLNYKLEWFFFLTEAFATFVPLLNLFWAGAFAINLWNLHHRRWTTESRAAELGLGIYGIFIAWLVFQARPFAGLGFGIVPALLIGIIVAVVEAAVRAYRLLRRLEAPPVAGVRKGT